MYFAGGSVERSPWVVRPSNSWGQLGPLLSPGIYTVEEMGRIEDVAAEKHAAGLALANHILDKILIDILPRAYEIEARNQASADRIGQEDITKAVRK